MLNITILPNGNLKLSASNACRKWIKENCQNGYWVTMWQLFEDYSTSGSFQHFDAGQANPFVELTSAPCVAECLNVDDDGNCTTEGRLWAFMDYMITDDMEQLKRKGFVIYSLVP